MSIKTCTKCKETKPITEFGLKPPSHRSIKTSSPFQARCKRCASKRSVAWVAANREKVNAQHKRFRQSRQAWIDSLKTGFCLDCKGVFPPYVLDFDHLPEYEKSFEISEAIAKKFSKAKILEEIKKCELVCSNCHRIRGYNRKLQNKKEDAMLISIREEIDLKEALEREVLESIKLNSRFVAENSDEE